MLLSKAIPQRRSTWKFLQADILMHIQEFETIRRHRLKLLICVMNDGAYGSEIHKLRQEGIDDTGAIFGRPDFAAIARGPAGPPL